MLPRSAACQALESRRLLSAGDPDTSFGSFGSASISFPGTPFLVNDVALQADGKLIVAGAKGGNMAVARLNVNGTIDTTFGAGGLYESAGRPDVRCVAVQPDGKIILAVTSTT